MNCLPPLPDIKAWSTSAWRTARSLMPVSLFFPAMPKLRYLMLDGNAAIHGSGLSALQGCKLDLLTPQPHRAGRCRSAPGGLHLQALPHPMTIPLLPMRACWPSLATTASSRWPMCNSPRSRWNTSPSSSGKRPKSPSCWTNKGGGMPRVLSAFFAEMTEWEQHMEQAGFEDARGYARLLGV